MANTITSTLSKYSIPDEHRSLFMVVSMLLLLAVLLTTGILVGLIFEWGVVLFTLPLSFVLCRLFVFVHDLCHGSMFKSAKDNKFWAAIVGFVCFVPSSLWKKVHDYHHGQVGNLKTRRLNAEVWTLTVNEYKSSSWLKRSFYRLWRTVFVRLVFTPLTWMVYTRIPAFGLGTRVLVSTIFQNVLYLGLGIIIHVNGWWFEAFWLYLLPVYFFIAIAAWIFYAGHQYEDTLWQKEEDWNLYTCSLEGSSFVDLGPFLSWVTGDVGIHHVHHVNSKIPFYKLRDAAEDIDHELKMNRIYFKDIWKQFLLSLYDEDKKKLVRIKDVSI